MSLFLPKSNWIDRCAALLVLLYGIVCVQATFGTRLGIALDPVWSAAQQRGVLRVATDIGWRPFADLQNGQVVGYDIDLSREIARRMGLGVEFVPTGYDALYDALNTNAADMIASALPYAPERGDVARFSDFYFNAGQVIVVRNSSAITTSAGLRGQTVGVALGSDADTFARRMLATGAGFTLQNTYDDVDTVVQAVASGKLDAAICDNVSALTGVQHAHGIRILSPALTLEPYVLAMPQGAFQLQAEVNRILQQLQREGFFDQLNQRWLK